MNTIEGVAVPPNDGDLPLEIVRDNDPGSPTFDKVLRIRIDWRGSSIAQQFPWTRPHRSNAA